MQYVKEKKLPLEALKSVHGVAAFSVFPTKDEDTARDDKKQVVIPTLALSNLILPGVSNKESE